MHACFIEWPMVYNIYYGYNIIQVYTVYYFVFSKGTYSANCNTNNFKSAHVNIYIIYQKPKSSVVWVGET